MSDVEDDSTQSPGAAGVSRGEVVRLLDHGTASADTIIRDMRGYWNGIRKGRAVPARSDVDPRAIARMLDFAFILERIAPGAARMRLAGRHLIDLMGMEVRGMPICAFLNAGSRGRFSDVLETVFKAPQIAEVMLHSKSGYARPEMGARMLLLPLRSDFGDVTRALGCLIADGEIGAAPRRFDLVRDAVFPIIDGGTILPPSPSTIGFAEHAPSFERSPAPARPAASPATTPEERRAMFRVVTPGPADPRKN